MVRAASRSRGKASEPIFPLKLRNISGTHLIAVASQRFYCLLDRDHEMVPILSERGAPTSGRVGRNSDIGRRKQWTNLFGRIGRS